MTGPNVRGRVILKQNRVKPVRRRHPWIFSGAIHHTEGAPADGDIVDVHDTGRNWLARGYLNQQSQITVRLLTWDENESIDAVFWRRRLERAVAARHSLAQDPGTSAYRLVHAESDYLPGLIVDRYAGWLAMQFLTLGIDRRRELIAETLVELLAPTGVRGIYDRSDVEVREKEGLRQRADLLWGEEPPDLTEVKENGHRFLVDLRRGHKTGFYLDQRENRERLTTLCRGREVLDAFSYTGGFAVHCLAGGASRVELVDSSSSALEVARRNIALNSSSLAGTVRNPSLLGREPRFEYAEGDVFSVLRRYRSEGRRFDLVILDPPKFAHTRREVEGAARAYKDINLLAFQLLRSGGILYTFSCSGHVSADLFQKIVFGALADTNRKAQIIGHLSQGSDHPVALTFPEGAYLKGLICRVW